MRGHLFVRVCGLGGLVHEIVLGDRYDGIDTRVRGFLVGELRRIDGDLESGRLQGGGDEAVVLVLEEHGASRSKNVRRRRRRTGGRLFSE